MLPISNLLLHSKVTTVPLYAVQDAIADVGKDVEPRRHKSETKHRNSWLNNPSTKNINHQTLSFTIKTLFPRQNQQTQSSYYCWTHGVTSSPAHTSMNCRSPALGNQLQATFLTKWAETCTTQDTDSNHKLIQQRLLPSHIHQHQGWATQTIFKP